MDNVAIEYWILIAFLSTSILSISAVGPTMATGAICGYFMRGISIRLGLLIGMLGAIPPSVEMAQTLFGIAGWLQFIVDLPIHVHLISILATVGLCWRQHKRAMSDQQGADQSGTSLPPGE